MGPLFSLLGEGWPPQSSSLGHSSDKILALAPKHYWQGLPTFMRAHLMAQQWLAVFSPEQSLFSGVVLAVQCLSEPGF